MNRRDFLNNTGLLLGTVIVTEVMEGCSKSSIVPTPTAGFTIDLSIPANSALKMTGGFILTKGIYIICTAPSTYIALSSVCTHRGCTVSYNSSSDQFSCPCHGGVFDISGKVLKGPPSSPLPKYSVTLTGNSLTVS